MTLLIVLSLALSPLLSTEAPPIDTGSISSNHASYDGSALELEGEILLEHGLGTMKSEKSVLTRQRQEVGEFPFAHIELFQDVELSLSNNASLECEKAVLDFSLLQGVVTSSSQVRYKDQIQKESHAIPFEILTPHLDVQFAKAEPKAKQGSYEIDSAKAHQGVVVIYDTLYELQAESVLYSKEKTTPPRIQLSSQGVSPCLWTFQNDRIESSQFSLDLTNGKLFLTNPSGNLSSVSQGKLHFTADRLHWFQQENRLTLQGHPQIQESILGELVSDQEVDLILQNHVITWLQAKGATILTSLKGDKLTTHGILEVSTKADSHFYLITTKTPSDENSQLLYEQEKLSICADEAQINYSSQSVQSVELKGNIKIFSRDEQPPSHRAVADTVLYDPTKQLCILKANPGRKVLFINDQKQMQISGSEIHISYDPLSKEESVQGVGQISLSFTPEETNYLNKVFQHVPPTP